MAEGILRYLGNGTLDVCSAGTHPWFVHPKAIEVMSEIGIDISSHKSKSVEQFLDQQFDYVITVCNAAKEECPIFPGEGKRLHIYFEDPAQFFGSKERTMAKFREVRDKIFETMKEFLQKEHIVPTATITN